jgi:hypothetical protein
MKKRIDHLQAENQTFKSDLERQRATVNNSSKIQTFELFDLE